MERAEREHLAIPLVRCELCEQRFLPSLMYWTDGGSGDYDTTTGMPSVLLALCADCLVEIELMRSDMAAAYAVNVERERER